MSDRSSSSRRSSGRPTSPSSPSFRQQDLREKLSRRRKPLSRSRSRSPKVRHKSKSSLRARSRTPSERSRSYSKHAYKSNRTLSPGELSDSPPFKTPYRPQSRSRDNGYRLSSSPHRERETPEDPTGKRIMKEHHVARVSPSPNIPEVAENLRIGG